MATKYKGIGKKLQVGEETTYGTLPEMEMNLNYMSESLKLEVNKEAEETLLALKTVNGVTIKGFNVAGDVSINLKPENLPFLKFMFKETADPTAVSTGYYKHTLVAFGPGDEQPSFAVTVDRGAKVVAYPGLVVESATFDGDVRKEISVKINIKGKGSEVDGTLDTELADPSLDTFTSIGGQVTIGGVTINDVTKASIDISQGLDDGEATYGTGLYNDKHEHGLKEIKSSLDAYYNSVTSPVREDDYKKNAYVAQTITWKSSSEVTTGNPYKIVFNMPKVAVDDASPTNSGKETIKLTIGGKATANGGSEPLTVEVYDNVATKY